MEELDTHMQLNNVLHYMKTLCTILPYIESTIYYE